MHKSALRQDYSLALSSYIRSADGEVIDARPEAAKKWAETAQDFPLEEIEAADLAAIFSCCCVVADPKVCSKLCKCFEDVATDDDEAMYEARAKALAIFQLNCLRVAKGHPAHAYFRKLFETEAGKRLLVDVVICWGMTAKVNKKAVCVCTDLVPADTEPAVPKVTRALQHIPDDTREAEELFRLALKPSAEGKAALAVLAANPTQALALLNTGDLEGSIRFQADVLDRVVEGVSDKGMETAEVKQLLHDHMRPEVLAELLTGRGDLPATAVSFAPLEVVLQAIANELEEGKDLFRLHYWATKLVDANYESYEDFLRAPVQTIKPALARSQWTIADLLIADLLDREVDGRPLLHELTLLRVDSVIEIESLDERISALEADLPGLLAAFSKPEEDEADDGPDPDMEREDSEVDMDDEEDDDDQSPRGQTDGAAGDLDL